MITGQEILNTINSYGNSSWQGMWPAMASWGMWRWAIIIPMLVVFLGIWVYTSLAYMGIAKRLKYKNPWLAWIPFARGAMVLQLGGFNWGWIFLWSPLVLIPLFWVNAILWFIGMFLLAAGVTAFGVLCYISHWRFFEKRGYYGWLALVPLVGIIPYLGWFFSPFAGIAFLIILGFVAWKDGTMVKPKRMPRAPARRSSSRNSRSSGRSRAKRR